MASMSQVGFMATRLDNFMFRIFILPTATLGHYLQRTLFHWNEPFNLTIISVKYLPALWRQNDSFDQMAHSAKQPFQPSSFG